MTQTSRQTPARMFRIHPYWEETVAKYQHHFGHFSQIYAVKHQKNDIGSFFVVCLFVYALLCVCGIVAVSAHEVFLMSYKLCNMKPTLWCIKGCRHVCVH